MFVNSGGVATKMDGSGLPPFQEFRCSVPKIGSNCFPWPLLCGPVGPLCVDTVGPRRIRKVNWLSRLSWGARHSTFKFSKAIGPVELEALMLNPVVVKLPQPAHTNCDLLCHDAAQLRLTAKGWWFEGQIPSQMDCCWCTPECSGHFDVRVAG